VVFDADVVLVEPLMVLIVVLRHFLLAVAKRDVVHVIFEPLVAAFGRAFDADGAVNDDAIVTIGGGGGKGVDGDGDGDGDTMTHNLDRSDFRDSVRFVRDSGGGVGGGNAVVTVTSAGALPGALPRSPPPTVTPAVRSTAASHGGTGASSGKATGASTVSAPRTFMGMGSGRRVVPLDLTGEEEPTPGFGVSGRHITLLTSVGDSPSARTPAHHTVSASLLPASPLNIPPSPSRQLAPLSGAAFMRSSLARSMLPDDEQLVRPLRQGDVEDDVGTGVAVVEQPSDEYEELSSPVRRGRTAGSRSRPFPGLSVSTSTPTRHISTPARSPGRGAAAAVPDDTHSIVTDVLTHRSRSSSPVSYGGSRLSSPKLQPIPGTTPTFGSLRK
jgi:hypothetical protein